MSIQMAVALSVALLLGPLVSPSHWLWVVLTTWIVSAGIQSRGEALYKGVQRLVGAAVGTLLAACTASALQPGQPATIGLIFVVLGLALWWRWKNYGYWAAGITFALGLLYQYFGLDSMTLLPERLEMIGIGGVIAVATAWWVLPIRTRDLVRLRLAQVLAACSSVLEEYAASAPRPGAAWQNSRLALGHLRLAGAPLHVPISRQARHLVTWLDAAEQSDELLRQLMTVPAENGNEWLSAARTTVGRVRRRVGGQAPEPEPVLPTTAKLTPAAEILSEFVGVWQHVLEETGDA